MYVDLVSYLELLLSGIGFWKCEVNVSKFNISEVVGSYVCCMGGGGFM